MTFRRRMTVASAAANAHEGGGAVLELVLPARLAPAVGLQSV